MESPLQRQCCPLKVRTQSGSLPVPAEADLMGSLTVSIDGAASQSYQLGQMALVASDAGAHGFSGSFAAYLPGYNQFVGLLTGPTAKEAIGNWAVPVLIDGQPHQFFGAWIAKQQ